MDREPLHQVRRAGEHQPEAAVRGVIPALGGGRAQVHAAATQGLPCHTGHAGRCVCLLGSLASCTSLMVKILVNSCLCYGVNSYSLSTFISLLYPLNLFLYIYYHYPILILYSGSLRTLMNSLPSLHSQSLPSFTFIFIILSLHLSPYTSNIIILSILFLFLLKPSLFPLFLSYCTLY